MSEITEVNYEEIKLLVMKRKCDYPNVPSVMKEMLEGVGQYIVQNKIEKAGEPLAVYHEWGSSGVVMDVGTPVVKAQKGSGEVEYSTIPGAKALKITHYGDYSELNQSHGKIFKYMKDNNIEAGGSPWEQYMTDPRTEPDKSRWQTEIYHPIK